VQHDDLAAARTLAPKLAVVPPVKDRGQQPEERYAGRDQEPEEERAALHASDHASGKAEEKQDYDQAHVTTGLALPNQRFDCPEDRRDNRDDHDRPEKPGDEADDELDRQHCSDDQDETGYRLPGDRSARTGRLDLTIHS